MAPDDPPDARRLALLVATGTYSDPALSALRAPTGDVRTLAAVLGDDAIGGFEVRELIDRPTEELKKEIEAFFGAGRPKDLLLLYVSGHGVLSQSRRFYFATASTTLQWLRSTAIEDSFVNDVMQASRARSIVLVLDCCHSGAFGKGLVPKSALSVDVEHRFEGRGRVTLTASTELEYAFEESDPATGINELGAAAPGSLFTRAFVEGLKSGDADVDEDGHVSVDDVYDYVCRRVRERSPNQTPGMAGDVRGQIVLARSSRRAVLPQELARAAASNMAGIREGAVGELEALLTAGGPVAVAAREALERLAQDDSRAVSSAALAALGRPPTAVIVPEPDRPQPPPPPPPQPPAPRPRPRRPVVIAAVLAAVAAAGAAGVVLSGADPEPPPDRAAEAYGFAGDGRQTAVIGAAAGTERDREEPSGIVVAHDGRAARAVPSSAAGVPAPPQRGDRYGAALASGDFDADGTADLAIGVPGRGLVALLAGGTRRLPPLAADDLADPPEAESFGFALVARDFDGDGAADLVVSAPGSPDQREATVRGSLYLFFGGDGGLTADRVRELESANAQSLGMRLAAGDVDDDGDVDIVEGAIDEPDRNLRGHLAICPGQSGGPQTCAAMGTGAASGLAVADVDGDGVADIVQGDQDAGTVRLWRGAAGGPAGEPVATMTREDGEDGDQFGRDVVAADIDADGKADVMVGAPGAAGGGSVTVVRGAASGFARTGRYELRHDTPGSGRFGETLSLLDLDGDGRRDLLVGTAGLPNLDAAVTVYRGREGGLAEAGEVLTGLGQGTEIGPESPLRIGR